VAKNFLAEELGKPNPMLCKHIENIRSFVRRKMVIFNNFLILKEPRMSARVIDSGMSIERIGGPALSS